MPIIPTTPEAQKGKIEVQGQLRQKVSETPSQQTSWIWWFTTVILAMQEA
jgi:hypothetical protein